MLCSVRKQRRMHINLKRASVLMCWNHYITKHYLQLDSKLNAKIVVNLLSVSVLKSSPIYKQRKPESFVYLILTVVGSNFMLKIVVITRLKRTWANICNVSDVRSGTEGQLHNNLCFQTNYRLLKTIVLWSPRVQKRWILFYHLPLPDPYGPFTSPF